jgi:DTW domain-containing protein YfiP
MHHREKWLTSNTAYFANLCLDNTKVIQRGLPDDEANYKELMSLRSEPLFLFPDEDSEVLTENFPQGDYHLIVPDGTWRQAKKFKRRIPEFKNIRTVKLPPSRPSRYLLRRQATVGGLSTFEAISRALALLERRPELDIELDAIFGRIVKSTMMSRLGIPKDREDLYPELLSRYLDNSALKIRVPSTL